CQDPVAELIDEFIDTQEEASPGRGFFLSRGGLRLVLLVLFPSFLFVVTRAALSLVGLLHQEGLPHRRTPGPGLIFLRRGRALALGRVNRSVTESLWECATYFL